ncbi:MAG: hypothetical protein DRI34_11585, partial [Deltaproteobacteria bacterium]
TYEITVLPDTTNITKVDLQPDTVYTQAGQVVERLQKFYDGVRDFKAAFSQEYTSRVFGTPRRSQGFLYIKKPGMMRWDYRRPNRKHFIVSGKVLYIYDPELSQVVVDRHFISSELSAAVTFLWGRGRLEKSFRISLSQRADLQRPDAWVLELVPRGPARFRRLWMVVRRKDAMVVQTLLEDPGGNLNKITFSKVSVNVGLRDDAFSFTVPPGVDVIEVPAPPGGG